MFVMKQNIIAIGGGDIASGKTLAIDKEIVNSVRVAGIQKPEVLFIPTASSDSKMYSQVIITYFKKLGCSVDVLNVLIEKLTFEHIKTKILAAHIVYVGGGNTLKMMRIWRRFRIDTLLEQARARGTVLCGISAGSICWFKHGNSDSRKFKNPDADYIKVTGLGFIDAFNCPHYDAEPERKASLKKMLRKYSGVAIALDDWLRCRSKIIPIVLYVLLKAHMHIKCIGSWVFFTKKNLYPAHSFRV